MAASKIKPFTEKTRSGVTIKWKHNKDDTPKDEKAAEAEKKNIVKKYGLKNWDEVWKFDGNKKLRKLRGGNGPARPGDVIEIPVPAAMRTKINAVIADYHDTLKKRLTYKKELQADIEEAKKKLAAVAGEHAKAAVSKRQEDQQGAVDGMVFAAGALEGILQKISRAELPPALKSGKGVNPLAAPVKKQKNVIGGMAGTMGQLKKKLPKAVDDANLKAAMKDIGAEIAKAKQEIKKLEDQVADVDKGIENELWDAISEIGEVTKFPSLIISGLPAK